MRLEASSSSKRPSKIPWPSDHASSMNQGAAYNGISNAQCVQSGRYIKYQGTRRSHMSSIHDSFHRRQSIFDPADLLSSRHARLSWPGRSKPVLSAIPFGINIVQERNARDALPPHNSTTGGAGMKVALQHSWQVSPWDSIGRLSIGRVNLHHLSGESCGAYAEKQLQAAWTRGGRRAADSRLPIKEP